MSTTTTTDRRHRAAAHAYTLRELAAVLDREAAELEHDTLTRRDVLRCDSSAGFAATLREFTGAFEAFYASAWPSHQFRFRTPSRSPQPMGDFEYLTGRLSGSVNAFHFTLERAAEDAARGKFEHRLEFLAATFAVLHNGWNLLGFDASAE